MKKIFLLNLLTLSLSTTAFATTPKTNTTMTVDYENVQQLIKNQYAANEGCHGPDNAETNIMCQYSNAASKKLEQLGYCMPYDNKPVSDWEWHKCPKKSK